MPKDKMTERDIELILSNPFYCLPQIDPSLCTPHEAMITEKEFIKTGVKLIEEIGVEKYLKRLLTNLKGGYEK